MKKDSKLIRSLLKLEKSSPKEEDNIIIWRLEDGTVHRDYGPAVIYPDGEKNWYQNGELHREDGPAMELPDQRYAYYLYGYELKKEQYDAVIKKKFLGFK